ncbi:hypothetical protein ES692_14340 [Psychroserpens burtonensis]|uniref:Uncharacterized protein n=1 Tax=Psychroserpens burtonensis TaxID=49278 RepID=A0A5C7B3Y5_9FLAO|nr:hypothetical protein [Psychroserpens burtonensis]TXE16091.1 hypothetical protein ES692_14340 [Psychroserpens burtonensis]
MAYYDILISIFISSWSPLSSSEENLHLDVVHKLKVIGSLNTAGHIRGFKTYDQSSSSIKTRIIKNYKNEILKDVILYSNIQLYFKEPKNVSTCFSRQDGNFNTIIAMGNHTFKKIESKVRENIYDYKMDDLKKATIDSGIIKFEIFTRNQ